MNNVFISLIVQIANICLQLVKCQTCRVAIFAQIQKLRTQQEDTCEKKKR